MGVSPRRCGSSPAAAARPRSELERARQQAVGQRQRIERGRVARAGGIAECLQCGQRQAGGEGEVELGREVPPAEVRALGALRVPGALDHAGEHRARQRQVGAERDAAGQADDREGHHVAAAELARPAEGSHRQQHRREPGFAPARCARRAAPTAAARAPPQRSTLPGRAARTPAPGAGRARRRAPASPGSRRRCRCTGRSPAGAESAPRPRAARGRPGRTVVRTCACARGRGACHSAATPSTSSAATAALVAVSPASDGSALAARTPASASPSRQATMRARCVSSPPRRAPQAWWITAATL